MCPDVSGRAWEWPWTIYIFLDFRLVPIWRTRLQVDQGPTALQQELAKRSDNFASKLNVVDIHKAAGIDGALQINYKK